jgi:hypothetical protein
MGRRLIVQPQLDFACDEVQKQDNARQIRDAPKWQWDVERQLSVEQWEKVWCAMRDVVVRFARRSKG